MSHSEEHGRERDRESPRPRARSVTLADALEQVAAEEGLLAEASGDHGVDRARQRGAVPGKVVVGVVDRVRAEDGHDHRFHQKLEGDAGSDSNDDGCSPARRPREAQLAPGRARQPGPGQHQDAAQREKERVAREDDEERDEAEWAEAAQLLGQQILARALESH